MRDIVIAHWRACGEEAYTTWLEAKYLFTNWYRWYRVSSGVAAVLPNQNPIESHHRSLKKSVIQSLRASTARVLNDVLPSVMIHAGNGADDVSSFGHYCGALANEWVVAASQLTLHENFRYVYQGRGPARLIQAILYNSAKYVSHGPHDGNLNSMKMSKFATTRSTLTTTLLNLCGPARRHYLLDRSICVHAEVTS
ncbi:hypothetical protein F442_12012 [Phytophthora nicotianae P10297]|uniref:Uncharacterized protein n=1 Tax=Phytophthora nicotianae P10297 TaxID=1317064 RepID=W2Z0W6_PHYNI|nr:hypothetical protein F442_12012 [Phytophthora nicotianae P10297]